MVAVVPARDEEQRLGATLAALARLPEVERVVVVDDGSRDDTARVAERAGAEVVRHEHNRGKAAALATGAARASQLDRLDRRQSRGAVSSDELWPPSGQQLAARASGGGTGRSGAGGRALLFVDADLEESAANLGPLCAPVLRGEAEMTIAVLPPQSRPGGGFGFVVRLARGGVERLTGWTPTQPLSGMRCLSREAFESALPLARGWGVEVGLTVDVLRAGGRVVEVPGELQHRVTGRDWRGQLHRARQYRDVWWALARRGAFGPSAGRRRGAGASPP